MNKIKATDNLAADVETKPVAEVKVEVVAPAETTAYTEAKKVNADFDKLLENKPKEPEIPAAEEKSGDDKPADDDTGKPADAEADEADEEIPAEEDAPSKEEIQALIERAAAVGLTQEQVESFSSKEDLENTVGILESRHKAKTTEEPAQAEEEKPFDSGLDPEKYDEGLIAAVNKIGNELVALKKENAALKGTVDTFSERDRRQAINQHTSWFDNQLAGLEGYEDTFGKGTIKDLEKGSVEFKNRAALDEEMFTIAAGYKAVNRPVPAKADLFQMALNVKFPDKVKGAVIAGAGKKLDRRASQALGRGSSKGSPATELEKAKQANSEFDKKLDG